ncbi:MAG: LamG protein [Segetibacter sp.]|jgi:hypothetical protein|nr:LamG protein [Segetibacter sp.]
MWSIDFRNGFFYNRKNITMNIRNKTNRYLSAVVALFTLCLSCQKMERPALGDYPKDANPPGGPLKFYAALDGGNVDSIRANFGVAEKAAYEPGVNGMAYKGSTDSYIKYTSANDFANVTSFTISFWLKKNGPPAAGAGTQWAFGLPTNTDIWHRHEMCMFFEDANNPSTADSVAMKMILQDQFIEFVGARRIPKLFNNQWHHVAVVYSEASSKLATYIDGVQQYATISSVTDIKKGGNPRGKLTFTNVSGFVIGGPGHYAIGKTPDDWMHNFDGSLDQFRLYGTALSAAEITALYNSKL